MKKLLWILSDVIHHNMVTVWPRLFYFIQAFRSAIVVFCVFRLVSIDCEICMPYKYLENYFMNIDIQIFFCKLMNSFAVSGRIIIHFYCMVFQLLFHLHSFVYSIILCLKRKKIMFVRVCIHVSHNFTLGILVLETIELLQHSLILLETKT